MSTAESKKTQYEWRLKHLRRYEFTLNKDRDKEAYDFLEKQKNKRAFLIGLILEAARKEAKNS